MSTLRQQTLVRKGLDLGFDLGAELVWNLALSKGGPVELVGVAPPGTFTVAVRGMVTNLRDKDIAGAIVVVGDEKVLVRSRELDGLLQPAAGDYLEELDGFLRRRIIAAVLDPTASFWTFQTRRLADSLLGRASLTFNAETDLDWWSGSTQMVFVAAAGLQMDVALTGSAQLSFQANGSMDWPQDLAGAASLALGTTADLNIPVQTTFVLTGPTSFGLGQSVQYTATLHFPDGSTALPGVTWGSNGRLYFVNANNPVTVQGTSQGTTMLMASTYYNSIFYNSNSISITIY